MKPSACCILLLTFAVQTLAQPQPQPSSSSSSPSPPTFNVYEASIQSVQDALFFKAVTCVEIVQQTLDRIKKYDGPDGFNSVISLVSTQELLNQAKQMDIMLFNNAKETGELPLFCVPMIVKDNYNAAVTSTSAGVLALRNTVSFADCVAVQALRKQGAILIGKSNMPDFALNGINTVSSLAGQTFNAYNKLVTPYGSSGGSGVASSASFAVIVLGSDTNGSIQNPSSCANLVGLRPTHGLLDSSGVLPLLTMQDVIGPMSRSVADAQTIFNIIRAASTSSSNSFSSSLAFSPSPGNIGFLRLTLAEMDSPIVTRPWPEVISLANTTIERMNAIGIKVIDIDDVDMFKQVMVWMNEVGSHTQCGADDFRYNLNQYLNVSSLHTRYHNVTEIDQSGQYYNGTGMFLDLALKSPNLNPVDYQPCQLKKQAMVTAAEGIESFMKQYNVSAFMYPSSNQGPPLLTHLSPPGMWLMNTISAFSGLPALVFPMGFVNITSNSSTLVGNKADDLDRDCDPIASSATWNPQLTAFEPASLGYSPSPADIVMSSAHCSFSSSSSSSSAASGTAPIGMTLLGARQSEDTLFEFAALYEQAYPQRRAPASAPQI